jgi:hypothetical protein
MDSGRLARDHRLQEIVKFRFPGLAEKPPVMRAHPVVLGKGR